MTKKEFLKKLEKALSSLPTQDRDEVMRYYTDYFEDAVDRDEAAILEELGAPESIAAQILEEYKQGSATESNSTDTTDNEGVHKSVLSPFSSINGDLLNSKLVIERGNEYSILIKQRDPDLAANISYHIKDDTLIIREKRTYYFGFNFIGFRKNSQTLIHITLPNEKYETFNITNANGSINISGLAVRKVHIDGANGGVKVDSMLISDLYIETVNGAIKINNVDTLSISTETVNGSITVNNAQTQDLKSECVNGSISLSGTLSGQISAESVNGSISVITSVSRNEFDWSIETVHGSVRIDGQKASKTTRKNSGASNRINCETVNGSVNINFV